MGIKSFWTISKWSQIRSLCLITWYFFTLSKNIATKGSISLRYFLNTNKLIDKNQNFFLALTTKSKDILIYTHLTIGHVIYYCINTKAPGQISFFASPVTQWSNFLVEFFVSKHLNICEIYQTPVCKSIFCLKAKKCLD